MGLGEFSSRKGLYKLGTLYFIPLKFLFFLFLLSAFLAFFVLEMGKKNKRSRISEENKEERPENQDDLSNSMAKEKSLYEVYPISIFPFLINMLFPFKFQLFVCMWCWWLFTWWPMAQIFLPYMVSRLAHNLSLISGIFVAYVHPKGPSFMCSLYHVFVLIWSYFGTI